jgi:DNA-binding transcriptional LysR family regulator
MLESALMELRQLEYFLAVAEEQNFTRAAQRVHISQSGVSAQIRDLERDLGAELFDRTGRTTTLTVAGQAALEHARVALAAVEALGQAVSEVSDVIRGHLTVGMVTGCTITPLFEALAEFHAAYPGIQVTLREDNSDDLTAAVRDGAIDLALVGTGSSSPHGLQTLTIISERLVAAVPRGHLLAKGRRRTTLVELTRYPIVCMPTGTGLRTVFDQACAAQGVRPGIVLEASAPQAIADLAARGLGAGLLSQSMVEPYRDRLVAITISDLDTPALLALVWRNTQGPALRALLTHARRAFGKRPQR